METNIIIEHEETKSSKNRLKERKSLLTQLKSKTDVNTSNMTDREEIKNQDISSISLQINYLRNLKLKLVNGKMVKDIQDSIIKQEEQVVSEIEDKKEDNAKNDFVALVNEICNLELVIDKGKVKKIER